MLKDNWPERNCREVGALFRQSLQLLCTTALGITALVCVSAEAATSSQSDTRPLVAAASSLRLAWPELMAAWPGPDARVSFGASGTLAQQIRNGAPFELFLSADDASIDAIVNAGMARKAPQPYAQGTLVLVFERNPDSELRNQDIASKLDHLLASDNARLALANPSHAPYGRAAREVLRAIKREARTSKKWVIGENAAQTLHFVTVGAARAGIIPASLISAIDVERFDVLPIDPTLHREVLHHMVLLNNASASASQLHDWLLSKAARRSLGAFGLSAPR